MEQLEQIVKEDEKQRHGELVICKVRAGQMNREKYDFFRAVNGVWLTKYVPARYLE